MKRLLFPILLLTLVNSVNTMKAAQAPRRLRRYTSTINPNRREAAVQVDKGNIYIDLIYNPGHATLGFSAQEVMAITDQPLGKDAVKVLIGREFSPEKMPVKVAACIKAARTDHEREQSASVVDLWLQTAEEFELDLADAVYHDANEAGFPFTLLDTATKVGNIPCVRTLLEHGADVNTITLDEEKGFISYPLLSVLRRTINRPFEEKKKWKAMFKVLDDAQAALDTFDIGKESWWQEEFKTLKWLAQGKV